MTATLIYNDPQTMTELALDLEAEFEAKIPCQGESCFKSWCDHPRQAAEFIRNLRYDWEVFLWERQAAMAAPA